MSRSVLIALLLALAGVPQGTVRADSLWSQSLGTRKEYVVYLPPSYDREPTRRYPVAYYLHGRYGAQWDWVRAGALPATMDSLIAAGGPEMIIVMPDGDDSWYTTWNALPRYRDCLRETPPLREHEPASSYCVPWPHYDDYIARDLVAHVDSSYRTLRGPEHRGIAGLSMGGYGAVTLAVAYPEVFGAAASHSGVLSPLYVGPHPLEGEPRYAATMDELRGKWSRFWPGVEAAFGADTSGWWARDPLRLVKRHAAAGRTPALHIDVGTDDPYADESRAFVRGLRALGIPHRYTEWPGRHDWTYWRTHAAESLAWLGRELAP